MHPSDDDPSASFPALLEGIRATDLQGRALDLREGVRQAAERFLAVRRGHGKVMVVGNGGSAAIALHLQTDLCHSLCVRCLTFFEPSLLTALSNDHGYERAFERMVRLWADPGDLLVAISSSGASPNILHAVDAARSRDAAVCTLSGFGEDNPLRRAGDLNFHVASRAYGPVETAHAVLAHRFTDLALALAPKDRS